MAEEKAPATYKILYIEDDEHNAHLVKRILEVEGYRVSLAPNGTIGLEKAYRQRPDLILLDLYLPDINGLEVARRLRLMEHTKKIPILVVSASHNPIDRRLSFQAGCNGYISKPIDVDLISRQVADFLLGR